MPVLLSVDPPPSVEVGEVVWPPPPPNKRRFTRCGRWCTLGGERWRGACVGERAELGVLVARRVRVRVAKRRVEWARRMMSGIGVGLRG